MPTPVPLSQKIKTSSLKQRVSSAWQHFGNKADNLVNRLHSIWPQLAHRLWLAGGSTTLLAGAVLLAAFVWPEDIHYSLASSRNCVNNPVVLPRLLNSSANETYELASANETKLLGYPILAGQTCVSLKSPFYGEQDQQIELTHSLLPLASKQLQIKPPEPIYMRLGRPDSLPVSTSGSLVFHLSSPDSTFDYRLSVGQQSVVCAEVDSALLCNLDNLNLKQDGNFEFRLERLFNGESIGPVFTKQLTTVEPMAITKSSIKPGQTVQNIPTKLTLNTNKPISAYAEINLYLLDGEHKKPVNTETSFDDRTLTISFAKPLKRRAHFELRLEELTAQDGGYLVKPYSLRFSTSGGPQVTAANIGGYGVGTAQNVVLWLDSEPKPGQNLNNYVSLNGGGFGYSVSGSGKQIIISPTTNWPRCTKFSVVYKDGLKNRYGVSGGSAWQQNSRTLCQSVSAIGTSVEGRGIYAYRFGSGSQRIIFVGGTHGDEGSSVYTLNSWIDQLEANFDSIPSNKTVIVVPNINPDGLASGRRTNAHDVDLNRNFPANNWKKDVIMPGGSLNKGGGGGSPLSEPESAAIASYTLSQNPKLVLTYHAVGSLAIANESGNSRSLATTYGNYTGYWALGNSEIGGIFTHDTTGAYEDWLHDKPGIPALLIELSSYGVNEFWNHSGAMWAMVKS